jgi:hypothetical protein
VKRLHVDHRGDNWEGQPDQRGTHRVGGNGADQQQDDDGAQHQEENGF